MWENTSSGWRWEQKGGIGEWKRNEESGVAWKGGESTFSVSTNFQNEHYVKLYIICVHFVKNSWDTALDVEGQYVARKLGLRTCIFYHSFKWIWNGWKLDQREWEIFKNA